MGRKKIKEIDKLIKMGFSKENAQKLIDYRESTKEADQESPFTIENLDKLWRAKYKFCRYKLNLNKERARKWTNRYICAFMETELEFRELKK